MEEYSYCSSPILVSRSNYFVIQLKDLIERSLQHWVSLFDLKDRQHLPIFKMELTFDEGKMEFYPSYQVIYLLLI